MMGGYVKLVISVRGGHCGYLPRRKRPTLYMILYVAERCGKMKCRTVNSVACVQFVRHDLFTNGCVHAVNRSTLTVVTAFCG